MPLTDYQILQINATIIAGILVLLTISSISDTDIIEHKLFGVNLSKAKITATVMLFPFAVSAIYALLHSKREEDPDFSKTSLGRFRDYSIFFLIAGFGYVIIFSLIYSFV